MRTFERRRPPADTAPDTCRGHLSPNSTIAVFLFRCQYLTLISNTLPYFSFFRLLPRHYCQPQVSDSVLMLMMMMMIKVVGKFPLQRFLLKARLYFVPRSQTEPTWSPIPKPTSCAFSTRSSLELHLPGVFAARPPAAPIGLRFGGTPQRAAREAEGGRRGGLGARMRNRATTVQRPRSSGACRRAATQGAGRRRSPANVRAGEDGR